MKKVHYDEIVGIEAYALEKYQKSFPLHFHDYYVVGILLAGRRKLYCGETQILEKGDLNSIPISLIAAKVWRTKKLPTTPSTFPSKQ